jgi:N-acetyl-alpha-D-muramate 1-phosphate uridylyltransferase
MRAMILAAGLGTRLKPFTEKHPKALFPINGKTLLQRNIEYLQLYGIKNVIINVHHFADQIIDEIKNNNGWGSNVVISDETNEVLETGGGLKKVAHFFIDTDEPFVLMNADMLTDLSIEKMYNFHSLNNPLATLAVTDRATSRYLMFDDNNILCGWYNEKTSEHKGKMGAKKAFSGIHIISPHIFSLIKEEGKFSMIDLYLRLSEENKIMAFDHSNGKLIDVGKPESGIAAATLFKD